MVSERMDKAGESPTNHFSVNLQTGRSKLVLSITQTPFSYSIKVVQICPDVTEVGSALEEARILRHEHDELILKFNSKRSEVQSTFGKFGGELRKQAEDAWEGVFKKLEMRKSLLDQSVSFHTSTQQFLKKLQLVESKCTEAPLSQDVDGAKRDLQKHQELKKTILEASMMTLQEGQLLLDKIRKAAMECGSHHRHATTSGCYYIEQQLINLRYKQIRLDELWLQRKIQLEQCIKFFHLKEEESKVANWFDEVGETYLTKKNLGNSLEEVFRHQDEFSQVEQQFASLPQKLKHLLWSLDYVVNDGSLTSNIDALREAMHALETKADSFSSSLDARKRDLSLAINFFSYAQDAASRLEGLEVLAGSLEHSTLGVEESYVQLLRGVYDATVAAVHEGTALLNRVGRDDPGAAAVNAKLTAIQDKANRLTSKVPSTVDTAKINEASFLLDDKLYKLDSWLVRVGRATTNRFSRLTVSLSDVNEFLVAHRALAEEVRKKQAEAKQLTASAEESAKVEDKTKVDVLHGKAKKMEGELEKLKDILEKRSKLALSFVVLQKRERQLSAQLQLLEEELKSQSGDSISEPIFRQRENAVKKLAYDVNEFEKIAKQFISDANELKTSDSLSVEFVLNAVSLILSNFVDRQSIVSSLFDGWKAFVGEGKDFRNQWKQLLTDARKTVEWIIKVEDNFFPKLAGELGTSLAEVQHHQKRLDEFKGIVKKVHEETEKHLRTAEILSMKGDSNGHKDFVINELIKTHTRFQARISEYKHLLNVATKFFENLKQLDNMIEATEKEYSGDNLPSELNTAREALVAHESNRNKLSSLVDVSSHEADDIIVRVRQQDAQESAKDEVRKVLQASEERRRQWEKDWDEHKKKLEQGLQLCQFYFDLKQLQNELDLLQRQLESRQGSYGNSPSSVQAIIQAFQQLQDLADAVGVRVGEFMKTADRMICDGHYDSRKIRHEVDETNSRWKHFYDTLTKYKLALIDSLKFYDLHNQCEGWISDAGQFLLGVSKQAPSCKTSEDVERLVKMIVEYRNDGGKKQDHRLKDMEVIATGLYGSVMGPEKMQHILDKNQDMYNAFIKAIEELRILQKNLINTEHILAKVEAVVEKKAPRVPKFVQPLQNAEITEGQRFVFECRLECDVPNPAIEWLRDNEPCKGFAASFKDGLCQLIVEETLLSDSALYTCRVTTDAGSTQTSARLRVKESQPRVVAPELLKHLRAAEAPEGTSHTFECHVTGTPFPHVSWFKDGEEVFDGPDYVVSCDQGRCTLKIKRLNKEVHSAKFKLKASNPGGEVVTSATLNVLSVKKPEFTKPLKDQAVDEGKGVRLECSYTGDPAPQIQWSFNDTTILPSAFFKIIIGDNFTLLEIKEVFADDCGTYSVSAKNIGGEAHTSCLVALSSYHTSAQVRVSKAPEKPRFVVPLQAAEVREGDRVKLECVVVGCPKPEVSWYHNGKPIRQTKDFDFTYDSSTGKCCLLIHELYLEDRGAYLCKAQNEHGSDTTVVHLHVQPMKDAADGGVSDEVPPKFTQLLKDIESTEGELVRFECRVIGHPAPVIKWFCGRNQIENTTDFKITSDKELQILTIPVLHKHDAGNYMIKATNNAGIAKCYATLMVKQKSESHGMKMRLVESSHSVQTDMPVQPGHVPPEIVKSFHDIHLRPGQPCTMEVVISGHPKPKIQWLFNNEPISSNVIKISSFGDMHSLHIPRVFDEDVGRYSVIAENDAGKAWCSALLVVVDTSQLIGDAESPPETPLAGQRSAELDYGPPPVVQRRTAPFKSVPLADLPPKFFADLRDVTSELGKRLVLEVLVEGRPEPLVTWYKDGVELSASPHFEISCVDGRARLVILSPQTSESGEYACIARNHLGETRSSARITFKAPGRPPHFSEQLQPSMTCKEGQPARFVVMTSGDPMPAVTWFREGIEIMPSPDFVVTNEGHKHTLLIPEAYPEDSGRFTVKVANPFGEASSCTHLNVQGAPAQYSAPKFVKPLHNRAVKLGHSVTLECALPVDSRPESIHWYHNEVEIFLSPHYNFSYKPDQGLCLLTIERVRQESRGRYVCTVYINGHARSTAMDLEVIIPVEEKGERPHFSEYLRNTLADEGSDVVLTCQVKGHPRPTFQWYHDGHLIRPSSRHAIKFSPVENTCTLIIVNITIHEAGIYTCCAFNEHGQEYTSAEVKFRPRVLTPQPHQYTEYMETQTFKSREIGGVSEQYFKPVFKKVPADLQVPEGHVARFDCVVVGRPTPDVYWFREGTRVQEDRMHKIVINEEGINSIIFEAVSPSDAGVYLCIARNRAGEDRFTVSLNVLPRHSSAPPRFSAALQNQTVSVGRPVTFTVEVEGIPVPTITWYKDEYVLHHGDKYHISGDGYRSTLYIPFVTLDDNAWFQCKATSNAGTTSNKFRLIVEDEQRRIIRKSLSPSLGQRSTSSHRVSPSPVHTTHILSPTQQLVHSKRTVSETTLRSETVHGGRNQMESEPAPQLLEPLKDQLLMVGGTAHFRCRIHSSATPTSHDWYFNDALIPHSSHKYRLLEGPNGLYGLDVENVGEMDAGIYKCAVHNKGGEVTCIAHLKVGAQPMDKVTTRVRATPSPIPFVQVPHIVRPITDVHVVPGDSASFEVVFSGPPLTRTTWLVNGRKVAEDGNFQIIQTSNGTCLKIKHVDPSMAGKVQCISSNSVGNVESSATLNVQSTARGGTSPFSSNYRTSSKSPYGRDPRAPCLTKRLDNVLARDGSEVVLSCSFTGERPLKVSWYHNGKNIDHSQDFAIAVDESSGHTKLVILDCMMDDDGSFKCVIQNRHGSDETECFLKVSSQQSPHQNFSTVFSVQDENLKYGSALERSFGRENATSFAAPTVNEDVLVPKFSQRYYGESDPSKSGDLGLAKGAPNFVQPIQPRIVVEGETCSLLATLEGDPTPSVEWFKDKQPLFGDSRHVMKSDSANKKHTLDIVGCSQLFDSGVYSCSASNIHGKATCTANVVVNSK